MFLSQIYTIESEIARLQEQLRNSQEQLQQYQLLREKAAGAITLLKEIQQQAAAIGEAQHWQSAVMHALQINEPQPPTPQDTANNTSDALEARLEDETDTSEDEYLEEAEDELELEEARASIFPAPVQLELPTEASTPVSIPNHGQIQAMGEQILKCRDWLEMRELLKSQVPTVKSQILREASLAARTKTQKTLIEKLPHLIAEYCNETGDRSDLDWLPGVVARSTEQLLCIAA